MSRQFHLCRYILRFMVSYSSIRTRILSGFGGISADIGAKSRFLMFLILDSRLALKVLFSNIDFVGAKTTGDNRPFKLSCSEASGFHSDITSITGFKDNRREGVLKVC